MNIEDKVKENHRHYLARKSMYLKYGYDIDAERAFVIEKAQPVSGRILEAGCGKGHFTLALAQRGFHFTSFDISEAEQAFARLNLQYYGLEQQVSFDIADGEALPYANHSFDFVFSVNLVHHLSNARKVLEELIRVLAPDGKLVISDINQQGLAIVDRTHALEGNAHQVGPDTLSDVQTMLLQHGFKVAFHPGTNQDTLLAWRDKSFSRAY